MSALPLVLDEWNVGFYTAMAAAARVSLSITREATIFSITRGFWSLAADLRKMLKQLHHLTGLHHKVIDLASVAGMLVPDRDESIRSMARDIREVHAKALAVFESAARKGLTNRSVVNSSIETVRKLNDELLEFAEAFETSLEPSTSEMITRALAEYNAGETVDYRSVV